MIKIIYFLTEVLGWNYWYQYELIDFIFKKYAYIDTCIGLDVCVALLVQKRQMNKSWDWMKVTLYFSRILFFLVIFVLVVGIALKLKLTRNEIAEAIKFESLFCHLPAIAWVFLKG